MPYPVALCWDGVRGYANFDHVHIALRVPPCHWFAIEFVPSMQVELVRDRSVDTLRDMTQEERERATLIAAQLARETPCE